MLTNLPFMRHLKKYLHLIGQVCMILLSGLVCFSCCTEQVDSSGGFIFREAFREKIVKIDLVGANKTIYYNSTEANITLNPADTVSRYVVYFTNDTGTVEITYKKSLSYLDGSCKENLVVVYEPFVSNTTFSSATINNQVFEKKYVEINR
jgi:hypothetical protein